MTPITINGTKYHLHMERAKELGLLTPIIKRKVGQFYKLVTSGMYNGDTYLLSSPSSRQVALIGVDGGDRGNRWSEAVQVSDISNITEDEFFKIVSGGQFELLDITGVRIVKQ